jgi:hypothetical protein
MLAAIHTLVRVHIVRVHVLVFHILGPMKKALAARFALKIIVLRVPTTMALQIGLLVGAILAEIAGEHSQSCVDQFVTSYVHRAAKCFVALVAAERSVNVVQVLQMLHEFSRMTETSPALNALMHGARSTPSLSERKRE